MSKIERVWIYKTTDGQIFETEEAAEIYQKQVDDTWYKANTLWVDCDGYSHPASYEDLCEWIRKHEEYVLNNILNEGE